MNSQATPSRLERSQRRTCIVTLGMLNDHTIASISGHEQEMIKKILEAYMPRQTAAAARAGVARIGPKTTPNSKVVGIPAS